MSALKKILVGAASLVVSGLILLICGVNPLQQVGTILAVAGTFYTISVWYDDFIEDKKCSVPMWVCYGFMLVTVFFLSVAVIKSVTACFIPAGIFAVGAIAAYAIEKGWLKKKAK